MVGQPEYCAAMFQLFQPLQLLLAIFAGWINRHQLDVIEYLQEENRVLKERLGGQRIRFTDAERRRLARKAQALGRKLLNEIETLVTPDTLSVRAFNKRGMFESDDLLRTGIASARSLAVHGPLSFRAQPSAPEQPTSGALIRRCPTPSSCSTQTAPRRNAQLLPSGCSLTNVDGFFGQFGLTGVVGRSFDHVGRE